MICFKHHYFKFAITDLNENYVAIASVGKTNTTITCFPLGKFETFCFGSFNQVS